MRTKKTARSPRALTALDDVLTEEGKLEEFKAVAIKEALKAVNEQLDILRQFNRKADRLKQSG